MVFQKNTMFTESHTVWVPRATTQSNDKRMALSKADSPPLHLKMETYPVCGILNGRAQKPSNLKCIIPSFKVSGTDIYWYISGTEIYKI
jgi:hypothetical protein